MEKRILRHLAERLAAGEEVDWTAGLSRSDDPAERAVIRSLSVIAKVSELHVRGPQPVEDATTPAAPRENLEPALERWGRFERLRRIGTGTSGAVYKAWDPVLEIQVALKLARPMLNGDTASMLDEARLLAKVRHENVVRIYGIEKHDGIAGIVMEYVEGLTLEQILHTEGTLCEDEVIPLGRKLALAAAAVHAAGLVHRDIKGHNVMREAGGRIVLMDFGAGSRLELRNGHAVPRGTPFYVAPEIFDGHDATPVSDVYSLGVLLFHLVTGRYPYEAQTVSELRAALRDRKPLVLADLRPELSSRFCRVVHKALDPVPTRRYASMGRMAQALERRLPRKTVLQYAAAALVLLVAAGFAFRMQSYEVHAAFHRVADSNRQLSNGDRIHPGDRLYLTLESSKKLYVYVLNQTRTGGAVLLFPIPDVGSANPVPDGTRNTLPGFHDGRPIFWEVSSAEGPERFLVIASRKPLAEFEEIVAQWPSPSFGEPLVYPHVPLNNILRDPFAIVLGDSADVASSPEPEWDELRAIAPLSDQRERQRGVWVRRFDLQNPSP